MYLLPYLLAAAIAYLLGSIPSGYLLARFHGGVDVLRHGSGKTGATNVLRTLGWKAALIVFGGDFLKGIVAVLVARLLTQSDPTADTIAGMMAVVGHNYSVFIGFKGGRGVTTGLGALAIIAPIAWVATTIVGVGIIAIFRYVSLGSILGACTAAVGMMVLSIVVGQPAPHVVFGLLGAAFIVISHKDNIDRLVHGRERKLGERVQM